MAKSKIKPRSLAPVASKIITLHTAMIAEIDILEGIRFQKQTSPQNLNLQVLRYISAKTLLLKEIALADEIVENEISHFTLFETAAKTANEPAAQTANA